MTNNKDVVLFFSCDESYVPFFSVVLESIREHADKKRNYVIKCLHTDNIDKASERIIKREYSHGNIDVEFVDITESVKAFFEKFHVRDYYSKSTYYRLFIPDLYPEYDKVLYLDSDIVLLDDVAKLYDVDLGDNYVGAIPDESVQIIEEFKMYVENRIGVKSYKEYFNAGILLMNSARLREIKFRDIFLELIDKVTFNVAQDQDYLNAICKGHVRFIGAEWDKMPIDPNLVPEDEIKLIHYNLAFKPWHKDGVLYEKYFWYYSDKTPFAAIIRDIKAAYDVKLQEHADNQTANLIKTCREQALDVEENKRIQRVIDNLGK